MTLKDLLSILSEAEIAALAEKVGTKPVYLHRCAKGYRRPSTDLCRLLVEADSRLMLAALRPDVYGTRQEQAA